MFTETWTRDWLSLSKFISFNVVISYLAHDVIKMQAIMGADVQRPLLLLQENLGPESPQEKESDKGDKQLWETQESGVK